MSGDAAHRSDSPSAWVRRFSDLVPAKGAVLDVACGFGRHLRWFASRGHEVTGVDRSQPALDACVSLGRLVQADLEDGPWPFAGQRFDAVIVTNYLWRPLLPTLVDSVAAGGVLIYETFALGNEAFGKPSNPDFLLRPGELLEACRDLQVVAYENGLLGEPARVVQRIAALRPGDVAAPPVRAPALAEA